MNKTYLMPGLNGSTSEGVFAMEPDYCAADEWVNLWTYGLRQFQAHAANARRRTTGVHHLISTANRATSNVTICWGKKNGYLTPLRDCQICSSLTDRRYTKSTGRRDGLPTLPRNYQGG